MKRKILLLTSIGAMTAPILLTASCSWFTSEKQKVYGFSRDKAFRASITNLEVKYQDADIPAFTENDFQEKFPYVNETYLFDNAAGFANMIIENDDDILGWKMNNSWFDGLARYDQITEDDNGKTIAKQITAEEKVKVAENKTTDAIIYQEGGPIGDVRQSTFRTAEHYFGRYGQVYNLNESQYGIIPSDVIYESGIDEDNKYIKLLEDDDDYNDLLIKLNKKQLTSFDSLRILHGNIDEVKHDRWSTGNSENDQGRYALTLNEKTWQTMYSSSMAFSMVDAYKTELLAKKLKADDNYQSVHTTGLSHGFWVGVEATMYSNNFFDSVDTVLIENNYLNAAAVGSRRLSGGWMTQAEEDSGDYTGSGGLVDGNFWYSRLSLRKDYGQLSYLETLFEDEDFLENYQTKVFIKSSQKDFNVGSLIDAKTLETIKGQTNLTTNETYLVSRLKDEEAFYDTYNLDHEYRLDVGHNDLSTVAEYDRIFKF